MSETVYHRDGIYKRASEIPVFEIFLKSEPENVQVVKEFCLVDALYSYAKLNWEQLKLQTCVILYFRDINSKVPRLIRVKATFGEFCGIPAFMSNYVSDMLFLTRFIDW